MRSYKMNEIFHRISIGKYLDKPVEDEKIETILQATFTLFYNLPTFS